MNSKMKRFTGLLNRSKSASSTTSQILDDAAADSTEANVGRSIRLFCESGSASNGGEEVLHLPVIVEGAESSPVAAAAAAQQIRVFMSREWGQKPHVQYNAIMLIRILSDNPGPTFTRNFDKSFVSNVKEMLKSCKDQSTQQMLRETLDSLEANKQLQEGMEGLIQMWRKEKGHQASLGRNMPSGAFGYGNAPPTQGWQQQSRRQLPPPYELASRVEEARNTAKILLQLIQSTPPHEVLQNALLKEFSERCQSAQKSMQGYVNCTDPSPDDDTMLTLIETNEQLSLALSRYQRSLLSARKAMGISPSPNNAEATQQGPEQTNGVSAFANGTTDGAYQPPSMPPPGTTNRANLPRDADRNAHSTSAFDFANQAPNPAQAQSQQHSDPFADPVEHDDKAAPIVFEPSHYGNSAYNRRGHQPQPSQSFSIYSEPTTEPQKDQKETVILGNAYNENSPSARSPPTIATPATPPSNYGSSYSPPRPAAGPWHNGGVTASYTGRQASATNGLTMHGGMSDDEVAEIDGHSNVGRSESSPTHSNNRGSLYSSSPVQNKTRSSQLNADS